MTWTGRSLYQNQNMVLPKSTFLNLKKSTLLLVKQTLINEIFSSEIAIFWMDNFSKVYISDYTYKLTDVPWELRNLTAVGCFISKIPLNFKYKDLTYNNPLPKDDISLWRGFFKEFKKELLESSTLTYFTGDWLQSCEPEQTSVELNLHSSFKPLELLDYNPSTLQGCLSTLKYLQKTYPSHLPFTIVVADIAFVTKWWKFCLSKNSCGNF
jgi:hypothetical protein